ncbi:MAG: hypothetical protein ABSF77_18565 [Spirochaetia bacterium]|jgi:hypothetical protein
MGKSTAGNDVNRPAKRSDGIPTAYSHEEAEAKAIEIAGRIARMNPVWIQTGPVAVLHMPEYYEVLTGQNMVSPVERMELSASIDYRIRNGFVVSAAKAHRSVAMHLEYVLAQYLAWENILEMQLKQKAGMGKDHEAGAEDEGGE